MNPLAPSFQPASQRSMAWPHDTIPSPASQDVPRPPRRWSRRYPDSSVSTPGQDIGNPYDDEIFAAHLEQQRAHNARNPTLTWLDGPEATTTPASRPPPRTALIRRSLSTLAQPLKQLAGLKRSRNDSTSSEEENSRPPPIQPFAPQLPALPPCPPLLPDFSTYTPTPDPPRAPEPSPFRPSLPSELAPLPLPPAKPAYESPAPRPAKALRRTRGPVPGVPVPKSPRSPRADARGVGAMGAHAAFQQGLDSGGGVVGLQRGRLAGPPRPEGSGVGEDQGFAKMARGAEDEGCWRR